MSKIIRICFLCCVICFIACTEQKLSYKETNQLDGKESDLTGVIFGDTIYSLTISDSSYWEVVKNRTLICSGVVHDGSSMEIELYDAFDHGRFKFNGRAKSIVVNGVRYPVISKIDYLNAKDKSDSLSGLPNGGSIVLTFDNLGNFIRFQKQQ